MPFVTMSSKGQVVLPAPLRHRLGFDAGAKIQIVEEPDGIRLTVVRPVARVDFAKVAGMVTAGSNGKPRRLADFDAATLVARRRQ